MESGKRMTLRAVAGAAGRLCWPSRRGRARMAANERLTASLYANRMREGESVLSQVGEVDLGRKEKMAGDYAGE